MNKRRLKVSADTLLHHITVPEPDFRPTKTARKQLFMKAVEAKYAKPAPAAGGQFWRAGQGALVFAGVGLFVLIGASSIIAMAGRAQPGDTLYSLNRAWERTQLAITQDQAEKLKLKLTFAEERLSEVAAIELSPNDLTAEVVSGTAQALTEIDDELDKTKLALEFGEQTNLNRDEVDSITRQFAQVIENYQQEIDKVSELSEGDDPQLAETALVISDVADSLATQSITEGAGYYLQLKGKLSKDSQKFSSLGYELGLTGVMDASVFSDLEVKIDGWVNGQNLSPELARYEDSQLTVNKEQTIYSSMAQLQQDGAGLFVVGPNEKRVDLIGEVAQDEQLKDLVGQEVAINAVWKNGQAELTQAISNTDGSETIIPTPTMPDTEAGGQSLPATDTAEPDTPPPGFDE